MMDGKKWIGVLPGPMMLQTAISPPGRTGMSFFQSMIGASSK
jgi:hypothetical protein